MAVGVVELDDVDEGAHGWSSSSLRVASDHSSHRPRAPTRTAARPCDLSTGATVSAAEGDAQAGVDQIERYRAHQRDGGRLARCHLRGREGAAERRGAFERARVGEQVNVGKSGQSTLGRRVQPWPRLTTATSSSRKRRFTFSRRSLGIRPATSATSTRRASDHSNGSWAASATRLNSMAGSVSACAPGSPAASDRILAAAARRTTPAAPVSRWRVSASTRASSARRCVHPRCSARLPGLRPDGATAAEQRPAEPPFELAQLLAERERREVEAARGSAEAAFVGDGHRNAVSRLGDCVHR